MASPRLPRLSAALRTGDVATALVVAGVLLAAAVEQVWELPDHEAWRWAVAVVLTAAVLAVRRRFPLPAAAGVLLLWVAVHTDRAGDDPFYQFVALLLAAYALGAHAPLRRGVAGLVLLAAGFAALNLTREQGAEAAVAGALQFTVLFVFGRLAARSRTRERDLEQRAERLEAEREERARAAVADERARIARDLHDALGHMISTSVLQVAVVRRRLGPEQAAERDVLLAVERSGRQAVDELRRMLGMLRTDDGAPLAPLPSLTRVEELVESTRAAGVPVDVRVDGEPRAVPAGVDVAAYRIVQEALTNVLKHAGGASAGVRVRYEDDAVVVTVEDNGKGAAPRGRSEPGHGLIGMRERVTLYGGDLRAESGEEGGFAVTARLPFRSAA